MAQGIIQTILGNQLSFNISNALNHAYTGLGELAGTEQETSLQLVKSFIIQRFKGYLLEQSIRYDIIDAVLDAQDPLADLGAVIARIEWLKTLTQNAEMLKQIYEPANRIQRILGKAYQPTLSASQIDVSLFQDASEKTLWEHLQPITEQEGEVLLKALAGLFPHIELFFEKVLVNDPDERIKQNRYNLLSVLNRLYLQLANFSQLVV